MSVLMHEWLALVHANTQTPSARRCVSTQVPLPQEAAAEAEQQRRQKQQLEELAAGRKLETLWCLCLHELLPRLKQQRGQHSSSWKLRCQGGERAAAQEGLPYPLRAKAQGDHPYSQEIDCAKARLPAGSKSSKANSQPFGKLRPNITRVSHRHRLRNRNE